MAGVDTIVHCVDPAAGTLPYADAIAAYLRLPRRKQPH
jgi:hypothetical protein